MGGQKLIHARKQTIKDLEVIFADRLWPKLASHKKEDANAMLVYSPWAYSFILVVEMLF
jgi:hypothetical protein